MIFEFGLVYRYTRSEVRGQIAEVKALNPRVLHLCNLTSYL
jgi:hypothetical protein